MGGLECWFCRILHFIDVENLKQGESRNYHGLFYQIRTTFFKGCMLSALLTKNERIF